MPPGWFIAAHYWDIESGGLDLAQRGHGSVHELFPAISVPRDGGIADLILEARGPQPRFAAVICEDIERSGRDTFNALRLEKELSQAGIPLFAADEPIDVIGANATTILVRRVKQGVAEWLRLQIKEESWAGLREHALQGFNVGRPAYGYLAGKIPHPVPAKAAEGRTKTRLALDPVRAPVVEQIFIWRVSERAGFRLIANRLNADPHRYPPPARAGAWTPDSVKEIIANPKYTGYMVYNRTHGKRVNPRGQWLWSPEPTHPQIVSRELWEQAQQVTGRPRSRTGDEPNTHPQTVRSYVLRGYIRCAICGRTYKGIGRGRPGKTHKTIYYACPLNPRDPRTAGRYPGHPYMLTVSETAMLDAIGEFFATRIFGPGRAALLAAATPAADTAAQRERQARIAALDREIADLRRRAARVTTELEDDPGDLTPEAAAEWRRTLRARFGELQNKITAAVLQREDLQHETAPAPDPALLDLLPVTDQEITAIPDHPQRAVYDAFDLQVTYHRPTSTATIQAIVTDDTPRHLHAVTDPDPADPSTGTGPAPAPVSHLPGVRGVVPPGRRRGMSNGWSAGRAPSQR